MIAFIWQKSNNLDTKARCISNYYRIVFKISVSSCIHPRVSHLVFLFQVKGGKKVGPTFFTSGKSNPFSPPSPPPSPPLPQCPPPPPPPPPPLPPVSPQKWPRLPFPVTTRCLGWVTLCCSTEWRFERLSSPTRPTAHSTRTNQTSSFTLPGIPVSFYEGGGGDLTPCFTSLILAYPRFPVYILPPISPKFLRISPPNPARSRDHRVDMCLFRRIKSRDLRCDLICDLMLI